MKYQDFKVLIAYKSSRRLSFLNEYLVIMSCHTESTGSRKIADDPAQYLDE